MKFNWGTGIALFYSTFAAVLIFAVIKSTTHDNSLVVDNYYEEDLKYQQHFDRLANTMAADIDFKVDNQNHLVHLQFPMYAQQGEILFFRPSDKTKDFKLPVSTNASGIQIIPINGLANGLWKVKINWSSEEKNYYSEQTIIL